MSGEQALYKLCARCGFRVPLNRSRCTTCWNKTFVERKQAAETPEIQVHHASSQPIFFRPQTDFFGRVQAALALLMVPIEDHLK